MTPIVIRLSGAPVAKGRPRFMRSTGHTYTPAKTRGYEAALRLAGQDAMGGRPPIEGPLAVVVTALLPIPASWSKKKRAAALSGDIHPLIAPDWDNYAKSTDALNEVVWRDDKQIVRGTVEKRYSAAPCLTVEVTALEQRP